MQLSFLETFYLRSLSGFAHRAVTNARVPYKTNYAFAAFHGIKDAGRH